MDRCHKDWPRTGTATTLRLRPRAARSALAPSIGCCSAGPLIRRARSPRCWQTTLPTAVVGGQIVDSTVTVGLTDALPVNGLVTIRLYASSDGAVDSASSLVRTFESPVNIKAGVQFAINVPIVSLPTTLPSGFYRLLAQATDPFGNVAITASGPGVEIAAPAVAFSGTLSAITLPAQSISGLQTPAMATLLLSNDGNIPSQGP